MSFAAQSNLWKYEETPSPWEHLTALPDHEQHDVSLLNEPSEAEASSL